MSKLETYVDPKLPEMTQDESGKFAYPQYENMLRQLVDDVKRRSTEGREQAFVQPGLVRSEPTAFDKLLGPNITPQEKEFRHYEPIAQSVVGNPTVRDIAPEAAYQIMNAYNPTWAANMQYNAVENKLFRNENLNYFKKLGKDVLHEEEPSKVKIFEKITYPVPAEGSYDENTNTMNLARPSLADFGATYIHELAHKKERDLPQDYGKEDILSFNVPQKYNNKILQDYTAIDQASNAGHLVTNINEPKERFDLMGQEKADIPQGERAVFYNMMQELRDKYNKGK